MTHKSFAVFVLKSDIRLRGWIVAGFCYSTGLCKQQGKVFWGGVLGPQMGTNNFPC